MNPLSKLITVVCFCLPCSQASLTIVYDFDPANDLAEIGIDSSGNTTLSTANQDLFTDAAAFWSNQITGYADGTNRTVTIHASAFSEASNGVGVTLGSAAPTSASSFSHSSMTYVVTSTGFCQFNIHPDATAGTGSIDGGTIRHEVGHILGIGSLWNTTSTVANSQNHYIDDSGMYTGANALAAYRAEFDPSATFIPIELDGGGGTRNGHWNEVADNFAVENAPGFDSDPGDGSAALTVLAGPNQGESLDDELMTGTSSGSLYLSDTSLGSLQDIGFTTRAFSIPEPSGLVLALLGCASLLLRRQRCPLAATTQRTLA